MPYNKKDNLMTLIHAIELEDYAEAMRKYKKLAEKRMKREIYEGRLNAAALTHDLYCSLDRLEPVLKKAAAKLRKKAFSQSKKHK